MKRLAPKHVWIAFVLLLAACAGPTTTPPPSPPPTRVASPTADQSATAIIRPSATAPSTATAAATATTRAAVAPRLPTTAAQSAIWAKWQTSPHANTYDLGKGPNTFCSRCHSPQNWDPASKVDAPPNCVSCKFDFDATVRIAKSNPLITPDEWRNIGCDVCHRIDQGGASAEVAWFNKASGNYEPVGSATALCEKCHTDTDVLRHRLNLGKAAHVSMSCIQCHDAHTTKADCASSQCHPALAKVSGHDAAHGSVSCTACHDASGSAVGPDNQSKRWITWQTTEEAGRKTTKPYYSHNLQKAALCSRCHYVDNPWKLSANVGVAP